VSMWIFFIRFLTLYQCCSLVRF